jgi:hypothetical protein
MTDLSFDLSAEDFARLEKLLQDYRLDDRTFDKEYDDKLEFTGRVLLSVNKEASK